MDSENPVILSHSTVYHILNSTLDGTKLPMVIKENDQLISNVLEGGISIQVSKIKVQLGSVSIFDHIILVVMPEE